MHNTGPGRNAQKQGRNRAQQRRENASPDTAKIISRNQNGQLHQIMEKFYAADRWWLEMENITP